MDVDSAGSVGMDDVGSVNVDVCHECLRSRHKDWHTL